MTRIVATMALAGLISLGTACSKTDAPTSPSPTDTNQPIFYTAIGASDGIGFGGSSPCLPFALDCPTGTGYVQSLVRRLKEGSREVGQRNLSIPGAVLSPAVVDLAASVGRPIESLAGNFIERQAPFVPTATTHVTIFAGGNDANTIGAALRPLAAGDRAAFVQAHIQQFGRDFASLVTGIAERAPNAQVVVLNLPNLARLPYAAGYSAEEREWLRQISVGFSAGITATRSSRVRIIDLLCHAPVYQASIYSGDGFHPNDAGYAILADLVSAAIALAPAAPPATCAFTS